mmetsp:Transcript_11729/g.24565  ORF Transcript_11729/g.24565 Transcript_11729/m.24565 type:complete len:347 (+) Transcript_11729:454-1494(+)
MRASSLLRNVGADTRPVSTLKTSLGSIYRPSTARCHHDVASSSAIFSPHAATGVGRVHPSSCRSWCHQSTISSAGARRHRIEHSKSRWNHPCFASAQNGGKGKPQIRARQRTPNSGGWEGGAAVGGVAAVAAAVTGGISRRGRRAITPIVDGDSDLLPEQLPRHIAVIMDGNSRWATKQGLPAMAGYERGVEALRELVRCCCEWEVPALTVFAFSKDNWSRSKEEVNLLLRLMGTVLQQEVPALNDAGVQLHFIGNLSLLPPGLQAEVAAATERTAGNRGLRLCIALSYSSRADLTQAVRAVAAAAAAAVSGRAHVRDLSRHATSAYTPKVYPATRSGATKYTVTT